MPKILHIGGVNSPHVLGIIEQVKQNTAFEQTIISYPTTVKDHDKKYFNDVPIYYYAYQRFFKNKAIHPSESKHLGVFMNKIINIEKPDIIHGHYLSKCAVPMYYAMVYSEKPGIVVPWSTWDITNNPHMALRIKTCVNLCSYVMCNHTRFLNSLLDTYKQPRSKGLFSFPPIRLYLYKDSPPNTDIPRLLITRKHYQDVFFRALPKVLSMFPKLEITSLSPASAIELSKKLGIYNRITFLPEMVSQEDFAKLIQAHNIVRSMAPDHGTSSTTIQAAYSGAVVLTNSCKWTFLKDNINVIECDLTVEDIERKLIYTIQNLSTLCPTFKKNNSFLRGWDARTTWKNLYAAYNAMLGVTK